MDWKKWLEEQQNKSMMLVTLINLGDVQGWETDFESVHRPDRGFFELIGANIAPTAQREVVSWDQPMLKEFGEGAVVLVYSPTIDCVLLQAKAEPGNKANGRVLLAPTLQTSMSNLATTHGGKKPPRAELITEYIKWTELMQDGGRYFEKSNNYAIVEIEGLLEPTENERWFNLNELAEVIVAGCANEHLLQVFALFVAKKVI